MASRPARIYWDTSVFIEFFTADPNSPYLEAIRALLAQARAGQLQICTSVLSIAEAAFISPHEFSGRAFVGGKEDVLDQIWADYPAILPVACEQRIARDAREMKRWARRNNVRKIEPDDLVHIATARYVGATAIHTIDAHWFHYRVYAERKIEYPTAQAAVAVPLPLFPNEAVEGGLEDEDEAPF